MRVVMRSVHLRSMVLALLLVVGSTSESAGAVIADLLSIGFQARGAGYGGRRVVRIGEWTPVVVQLTLQGATQFAGRLRIAQRDRDGDVCYNYRDVLLGADSAPTRTYTLYTLPITGPHGGVDIQVELLDSEGNAVEMVSDGRPATSLRLADPPTVLSDDEDLIVEISSGQMGRIKQLADADPKVRPLRPVNVALLDPAAVPDRWHGLESVDYLVWDDADPDALNEAQRQALAEWVRQGGVLVLATARHGAALQKSDVFGEMLPVQVGERTTLQEAERFRRNWLDLHERSAYAEPFPRVKCAPRSANGVRRVFPERGREGEIPDLDTLIARGRHGRGAVVFVGAALRDLIDPQCEDATKLLRALLELRTTSRDEYPDRTLHDRIEARIGFAAIRGAYMVFAMLFVMAYVGLATLGSWGFLKARGWQKHNWTVFAALAIAVSAVSITAAQTIRGVGRKLHQLTVVDAVAGRPEATALAYFGLKTGTHSVLDVWLAENYARRDEPHPTRCFLRPLPVSGSPGQSGLSFADPGSYELRPATAELLRVPIRATLKQLEGHWRGELHGEVAASVRIVSRRFERSSGDENRVSVPCFDDSSRITNRLGTDLERCFLLQPTINRYRGTTDYSPRSGALPMTKTLVHDLGALPDGETLDLASLYQNADGAPRPWDQWHRTLLEAQDRWGGWARLIGKEPGGARLQEPYQGAMLMATTLSEYDEVNSNITGFNQGPIMFSRQRVRPLDLSNILTEDMVLLVGFSRQAGPVSLCTRTGAKRPYKRLEPTKAWTVYRIVIPVENRS